MKKPIDKTDDLIPAEDRIILEQCYQSAKNITSKLVAIITPEKSTVVITEEPDDGELFGKEVEHAFELQPSWDGWKEYIFDSRYTWFSDFGYFKTSIENGKYASTEEAVEDAARLHSVVSSINFSAKDNGSFDNSVMLSTGLEVDEALDEYGTEFVKILERVFKVGQAQSKQDTMAAMKKKAIKGDLAAQKTILVHKKELKSDKHAAEAGSTGGVFAVYIDQDDAEL